MKAGVSHVRMPGTPYVTETAIGAEYRLTGNQLMLVDRRVNCTPYITSMAHRQGNHMKSYELLTCIFLLLVIEVTAGQRSVKSKEDCAKDEYWSRDGFCCDKCAPGYRLVKKCSSGVKSTCEICKEGTYQDKINYFPNCFRCQKCIKHSRPHAVEISSCTPQSNTVCECQLGYRKRFLDSFTWDCVLSKGLTH